METLNAVAGKVDTGFFSLLRESVRTCVYRFIGAEINSFAKYADRTFLVEMDSDQPSPLFQHLDSHNKSLLKSHQEFSTGNGSDVSLAILNGTLNHSFDIEADLNHWYKKMDRQDRVICILYNPYLSFIYKLANFFQLRKGPLPNTFITKNSLITLTKLAGFELVSTRNVVYSPFRLIGIGSLINKIFSVLPFFHHFSLAYLATLRPVKVSKDMKLSIIIPARNEKGNIENAIKRIPDLPVKPEVIFVEGNSTDQTWEEILRVKKEYKDWDIKVYKQPGKGKNDAVRVGFANATGELVTILDADLTMPPELLGRFYNAYKSGYGDFINGSRLVYPMEGDAMRFLNHLGNIFFAKALSYVLGAKVGDALCGTKLLRRVDYQRIVKWRGDFGDFDPFGDFELLFAASVFGYGIFDVPIRYGARTYGTTNISRFTHGAMLLKMTVYGFFRLKIAR